ncbi:MAG: transporter substrate-binding domain-containing protein [Proteobacteria bacterium]|nr:transporter substrate-binding domain-containing protein [Pseudomonadota bacterium]MBU1452363.1 transporter substrate-binding domain-containing protein [Pseudomonadota bacterium]MBU2467471.1 transporter substrate-binding domain-containing protein [Pseudomonadota bacterium]
MRKSGFVVALVALLALALASAALAGPVMDKILKRGELVVGTAADYPPFNFKAADGKIMGLDIDLATILAKAIQVKLKIEVIPFPELLDALNAGKVDLVISGMTMTPVRNAKVYFAGPYFITGQGALMKGEMMQKVRDLTDFNKPEYTITVPKGTTSEITAKQLLPKAKFLVMADMDQSLKALLAGKAQAMVTDFPYCVLASFRYKADNLAALQKPFTFEPLGVAVPANDPLLQNMVDNYLGTLQGGGGMEELKRRWFKESGWIKKLPR